MLKEFQALEERLKPERMVLLRRALRHLLRHQFVFSGDSRVTAIYDILTEQTTRLPVDDFFHTLGYRIMRNGPQKWIGILPDDDEWMPPMKLDETIATLVLAHFWQEQVERGNVQERAVVETRFNLVHDFYRSIINDLSIQTDGIKPARFLEILREHERRGLVRFKDVDNDEFDHVFDIRPMIREIAGADSLKRIEAYLSTEERQMPYREKRSAAADPIGDRELDFDAVEEETEDASA